MKAFFLLVALCVVAAQEDRCFKNIKVNGKLFYDVLKECVLKTGGRNTQFYICVENSYNLTVDDYPIFITQVGIPAMQKQLSNDYNACKQDEIDQRRECIRSYWREICSDGAFALNNTVPDEDK